VNCWKSPNFVAGSLLMFGVGMILSGTLALMPSMMQVLMNYPVFDAGWMMAPRGLWHDAGDVPRRPHDQPSRQSPIHPGRFPADRGLVVADDRVFAADGVGAILFAGFCPGVSGSAAPLCR